MTFEESTAKALEAGWKLEFCPDCGFFIATIPTGKHYCPKCHVY